MEISSVLGFSLKNLPGIWKELRRVAVEIVPTWVPYIIEIPA
jgi:hypothetical protein